MRFKITLALLALPMMSACNQGGGSSVEELEDRYGRRGDVTENWLVGRWAEVDDRDCDRTREFRSGGDLMDEDGERREWQLNEGRRDVTLEIDRDEFRAERYGSTLVLVDDRDRTTEYKRCGGGGSGAKAKDEGSAAAPAAPAPAAPSNGNPQLAAEIAAGVEVTRRQLPIRNGPFTITSVSSSGTTLILNGNMSVDVLPAMWSQIETGLRQRNCEGPSGAMIRRGATVTTNITDSTGENRSITTSSCPGV